MKSKSLFLSLLLGIIIFSSCVGSKKYKSAVAETEQLKSQLTELNTQVSGLQKQVSDLTAQNKSITQEVDKYKAEAKAAEEKRARESAAMEEELKTMEKVADRIGTAVADFEGKGMEVYSKDGHVYVSMEENLLYKSGSANLNENGKKALGSLASALNDYPNLPVIVVGHTDDKQFKKGSDNWSLSTERANGVIRVLRDDFKVEPSRLTAAGKGKYAPIADNTTAEGRAKNRRTDIILNPDMQKIWENAKQQQ
jgi:chemotaxis protein MotB